MYRKLLFVPWSSISSNDNSGEVKATFYWHWQVVILDLGQIVLLRCIIPTSHMLKSMKQHPLGQQAQFWSSTTSLAGGTIISWQSCNHFLWYTRLVHFVLELSYWFCPGKISLSISLNTRENTQTNKYLKMRMQPLYWRINETLLWK